MAQAALTLRQATVRSNTALVSAALILGGALLTAGAAQIRIPLPFTPVPITGQTFAVVLVGAGLGSLHGAASMGLYLVLGGIGLPVFAGATGGWDVLGGPTGGYIVGFIVAGYVTGRLAERRWDRTISSSIGAMLIGNTIIYLFGLPWLAIKLGTELAQTLEFGLYPFVPGDVLKLYLAAVALPGAWKLVGRFRP